MINLTEFEAFGQEYHGDEIAIVGMALRVPGANTIEAFWQLLQSGLNPFEPLSEESLRAAGVDPGLFQQHNYVRRSLSMNKVKAFDPGFFGFSALDAALMDPQYRHFLELCWEVFEHAGEKVDNLKGTVGVYAGSGQNGYLLHHLAANPNLVENPGHWYLRHVGNDKDFMTTRASYHLNLHGPSVNVQTACSTSLVASHLACQSLISRECDMAIAGGVTIAFPHAAGYLAQDGGIEDPRGECRSFDASSKGTVFSSGGAVILLKRLEDALKDKNTLYGVIRSSAVNNDGATKASFTAPSIDGQISVILEALDLGEVHPESIGYVEAHGTGTPIGDPIEVEAMSSAWRTHTKKTQFAALSSAKSNVGHMDTASGVVSIIKALGCLYQGYKYPTAHYKSPNPGLSIETSPFYVSNQLEKWDSPSQLRRACVSALGVGGTNCHMILEESPRQRLMTPLLSQTHTDKANIIIPISAKTPSALQHNIKNYIDFFQKQLTLEPNKRISLADIAHTLVNGRCHFPHRAVIQALDIADALATLQGKNPGSLAIGHACDTPPKKIVFAFTGQGTQYFNMGLGLYNSNQVYRETLDQCAEILIPVFGYDIRTIIFNDNPTQKERDFLDRIDVTHPILFSMAYGMAKAWIAEGYTPDALIGHSLGEYVAATIAGVFELKEVLALVCKRGELMHSTPRGVMLSVAADESEVIPYLEAKDIKNKLSIAGVNVLGMTVVAGEPEAGSLLIERLDAQNISCKALRIPIASHCFMMDPILDAYEQAVAQCTLKPPTLPIVSNIDGRWLEPATATQPSYWRQHLRSAVRFADGTSTLMKNTEGYLFIEIGPGSQLTRLIERHPHKGNNHQAVSTMPGPADEEDSGLWFDLAPARIWSMGGRYDWSNQNALSQGQKHALPTYSWDHQDYWFDLPKRNSTQSKSASKALYRQDLEDWFYLPGWQQGFRPTVVNQHLQESNQSFAQTTKPTKPEEIILIITDHLSTQLHIFRQECLKRKYHVVIALRSDANAIVQLGSEYLISGLESTSYIWLLDQISLEINQLNNKLSYVVNWVEPSEMPDLLYQNKSRVQHYFEQNLYLVQALGSIDWTKLTLGLVGKGILEVFAGELDDPSKVLAFSPFRTLAAEHASVQFVSIDIQNLHHIAQILPELEAYSTFSEQQSIPVDEIAFRGSDRFFRTYHATPIQQSSNQETEQSIHIRRNGVYLFVGLGDLAITAAQALVSRYDIVPIFVSRSKLPDQIHWEKLAKSAKVDSNTRRIRQLLQIHQHASSITCLQADASQSDQMTHVFEQVLATHGAINGIFHSAGVLDDQLLALKTMQSAEKVLAPKVFGLDAYDALFESNILDFLVLYSSVSSLIGVAGQVDYSAANAYLAAYARYQNQGLQRPVIALHWGIWRDIGMATEEAKRQGLQDSIDDFDVAPFHQISWLVSKSFGSIQLCQGTLSSASSWILQDHQTKQGLAVYPGSGYIDTFANVYQNLEPFQSFEIRDLIFQAPFILSNNCKRFVGVAVAAPDQQQNRTCQFLSWHSGITHDSTPDHDQVIVHASCEIRPLKDSAQAPSLTHLRNTFNTIEYHDETQHAHMNFGARWQTLRATARQEHEALLQLALPQEFISDLQEHPWHPGLLDIAIGGQFLIPGYESEKTFYVPLSYNSIKSYGSLTPQLYSHCRYRPDESSVEVPVFDFTLYSPDGNVLVDISGFHLKKIDQLALDGPTLPTIPSMAKTTVHDHKIICPLVLLEQGEETLFEKLLTFGINPEDGAEALLRVLSLNPLPSQILISSMPFDRYCNAVSTTISNSLDTSHQNELMSRPAIATLFEALQSPLEQSIGEIWEQALGIKGLGRQDGFFELGGHSLLLIQIIARLKKKIPIKINMADLFEVTTIAKWAELIEASTPKSSTEVNSGQHKSQNQVHSSIPESSTQISDLPLITAILSNLKTTVAANDTQIDHFIHFKEKIIGAAGITPKLRLESDNFDSDTFEIYPATYSQKALHFLQTFQPESVPYSIPFEYWFSNAINPIVLQKALNIMVSRHDILRTVYRQFDGELKQVVYHRLPITLDVINAADWTKSEIRDQIFNLTQIPFDLNNGPLIQSTLFKKSETCWAWYLSFHHISFDHLAILQFAHELDHIYSRLLISPDSVTQFQPNLQMRDYASWQAQYQTPDYLRNKMGYWIKNIPDPSVYLDLPTDFSRQVMNKAKGQELIFSFPKATTYALTETAKQFQVSRYLLSMAIYASLLHRYSGSNKIIIGTPFANRGDQEELQKTLGCFMNTLPLVFDFDDNPTLHTLLQRTQAGFLEVFKSQDVAFELIIETLQPPRNTSHHPLFQVAFMYQDPPMEISLGGLQAENKFLHNGSAKFDMLMWLWDRDSHIEGSLEYSQELFTKNSILRFLDVYFHLIEAMTNNPNQSIQDIQLVHPSRVSEAALFGPKIPVIADNLPALFEDGLKNRVKNDKNAFTRIAATSDTISLTYQQLESKMNQVSAFLKSEGVKNGDLVGICMHRSAKILPILLGILKSGGAYVPLDPDYPNDRLKYMISHSGMGYIITENTLQQQVTELLTALDTPQKQQTVRLLLAQECLESSIELSQNSIQPAISPDQTAYVIYTSGSTGLPKGVNVPHSALVNFLTSMRTTPGFESDDRLMALTTLSFDISILEIFLPIVSGGTVDIVPTEISRDGFALLKRMSTFKPTIMQATPATWRLLFVAGFNENFQDHKKLKVLIGGEALPQDLAQDLLPCVKELWNMYGPTETTIWSTCQQITDASAPIEIGTPIANTQCYILDEHQCLLPPGVPGELYIGGQGVSHGYLHQDDLTQERFIACPDFADGLLYKTGDRVTRLPQGVLRYHNRLDFQVKIRGYRIELGEIEHQLLAIPELASGAVIAHHQRILAFYLLKTNTKLSKLKIRKYLATVLPKHMMPDFYIELEALPLTPAGKIDRKKLARIDIQLSKSSEGQKPTTPSECYYANIWGELLKKATNTMSINDNFFDIGGHSLLSLQVVAQTKKDHDIQMPASALVLNTLSQLAVNYPLPELEQIPEQIPESITPEQQALQPQANALKFKLTRWWQSIKNR